MSVPAATLSLDQAAGTRWDALIIGAGPAGAMAALLLARSGVATLLVERKAFPRDKPCGACLNAHALASLERAGLLDGLRAAGARPISHILLRQSERVVELPLPRGIAISRARLDASIVTAAVEAGCAFLPETGALVVEGVTDAWCRVELRGHVGERGVAQAGVVLVADGLAGGALRRLPGMRCQVSPSARIGLSTLAPAGAVSAVSGAITMAIGAQGYVGMVEVEGGRTNIAAATDASALKKGGAAACVGAILDSAGIGNAAGRGAQLDWQGTPPLTRRLLRPAAHRLLVLGDAAGYVEPFTGEGMAWALAAAEASAPLVRRALSARWDPDIEQAWVAGRRRAVTGEQLWCRAVSRVLRHPVPVRLAMSLLRQHPQLARPLLAHLTAPARTA